MIYDIEKLKELITPVLKQYNVKNAVLFGSYSRGDADEKSDVDLLVDSGLRGFQFIGLASEIENTLKKNVDVFDVTHLKQGSRIATEIENSGVKIYG